MKLDPNGHAYRHNPTRFKRAVSQPIRQRDSAFLLIKTEKQR
ncbi:hypothetical protein [Mesorhizobium sp. M6A.T.Ce.TU.002.03.1.1]|nr:hypothetical protein [Mesorhizobium sp. M6A.T.Ce.TU.002.03.1.1]